MTTDSVAGGMSTSTDTATGTDATSRDADDVAVTDGNAGSTDGADGADAVATRRLALDTIARRGLTVGAVVLLSLAIVRGVAGLVVPLGGVDPAAWQAVLGTGVVVTVGSTLAYAALTRLLDRPDRAFVGLAAVVLAASMLPLAFVAPTLPGVTTAVIGVLAVMHVVAAVGSVVVLTGRWP